MLSDIAVYDLSGVGSMSTPLNFTGINSTLYSLSSMHEVDDLLYKILSYRKYASLRGKDIDVLRSKVFLYFLRRFNPSKGDVTNYISSIINKIIDDVGDSDIISLDSPDDSSSSSSNAITTDYILYNSESINNLDKSDLPLQVKGESLEWSDWLSEVSSWDNSEVVLPSEQLNLLISLVPFLHTIIGYRFEELRIHQSGDVMFSKDYKKWFNPILISMRNKLKLSKSYIKSNLSRWLSLFMQNDTVLTKAFIRSMNSDDKSNYFTSLVKSPSSAKVDGNKITVKAKTWYNIYELDISSIVDMFYDDYFGDKVEPLYRLDISGTSYYNVMNDTYVVEGDLEGMLRLNIIRLVANRLGYAYITTVGNKIYFESRVGTRDEIFNWFYLGRMLTFSLSFKGKEVLLEG